jgi:predicted dehydrogenase
LFARLAIDPLFEARRPLARRRGGSHRLNRHSRPACFFRRQACGGILVDIASHQFDQFLFFTGADDAEIVAARVANINYPGDPGSRA